MTDIAPGARVHLHQAFRCCPYAGAISSRIHDYLAQNGYTLVADPADADVHVVNTCGSDARQASLTYDALAAIRARTPAAAVVATGCLVSIEPGALAAAMAPFARAARFDPRHLAGLDDVFAPTNVAFDAVSPSLHNAYTGNDFSEGWAHVLASTGCLGTCSFCAIRRATGRPKSRSVADVLGDIARAVDGGVRDVLLVSTDLSAWGTDRGESVVDLLRAVVAMPGEFLVSGESFEPTLFLHHFEALLPLFASGRFAFVGLPIQSGSARVLRRMDRTYDPDAVVAAVRRLKAAAPDLLVRTDLLYGFADETEAEFEASLAVSRAFDLPSFNVYQPRPGTAPLELGAEVLAARRDRALEELQRRAQAGWAQVRRWADVSRVSGASRGFDASRGVDVSDVSDVSRTVDVSDVSVAELVEAARRIGARQVVRGADGGAVRSEGSQPAASTTWVDATRLRFRNPALPPPLVAALAGLVLVGDAVCHLDGAVVLADPELEIAALIMGAGGDPAALDAVLAAWSEGSGRTPDRARVALYLWLLHAEHRLADGHVSPHEQAVAERAGATRPHGGDRAPRVYPKAEYEGDWRPEVGLWAAVDDPAADALLGDLGLPGRVTASYRLHACNDVLRVDLGPDLGACVLKVYGKPVWGPLFELERHLQARLAGGPATVPAPLVLPDGRSLLRVGPRVAVLTPYLGDTRPGSGARDLDRLASAHAALHAVDGLAEAFPEIDRRDDDLPLATLREHADKALAPDVVLRLVTAWEWAHARLVGLPDLPAGLVHGSLHRDHAVVLPDGRVAILDLEKARIGPLVHDAVRSAVYAGYRGNDEKADPGRIVYYLRAYDRVRPLTVAEREALVPSVILALLRDVKALGQERAPVEAQRRHAMVIVEFFHNRGNLAGAFVGNLGRG
ncbi:MAG: radical SAM protein [Pseudomonadota bacterium]|nr:radical SAM protein [Pseudomonadota bacterium]